MTSWVRLWLDMPTDPKWRVVARKAGCSVAEVIAVFTFMLTNAGANATERGKLDNWSDEDVAAALDMEEIDVAAIREAMQGKTLEGESLSGWEKRQPKREDNSAERAKEWRERKRTQANAPKRPDAEAEAETEHTQSAREDILRVKADIVSAYWPEVPPDTGRIDVWMGQGYALGLIAAVVPDIVRRKKPRTLAYCDKALDDAAQKRAPPHPPDAPQGEALVFIEQDSDAWARAVAIEPKRPLQTKKGRGAYFAPDIAKQALAEFPTQARA